MYRKLLESFNGEAFSNSHDMSSNEFEVRATAFGGICAYFVDDSIILTNVAEYLIKVFDFNNGTPTIPTTFKFNADDSLTMEFTDVRTGTKHSLTFKP